MIAAKGVEIDTPSGQLTNCRTSCSSDEFELCDPAQNPAHCPPGKSCSGLANGAIPVCE